MSTIAEQYLVGTRAEFERLRTAADAALAQVEDDAWFTPLDGETNSIAVLVKHMAGNLKSRWTDLLTTDGEKPDRDRDGEFEIRDGDTRASLAAAWDAAWQRLFDTLDTLEPGDLDNEIRLRGERLTVIAATQRQLAHAGNHVGQIILLARHFRGPDWQTLTIPRGQSRAYTDALLEAARQDEAAAPDA
jgi:hypothetical protein